MERNDADQEGVQLPPAYYTRLMAREEASKVILQHLDLCPFASLKIEERVRRIEGRFLALLGFMAGAGLLGGATGAMITRLLGPSL